MAENTEKAVDAAPKPPADVPKEDAPAPDAKPDEQPKDEPKPAAAASQPAAQPTIEQSLEEGIGHLAKGFGSLWGVMKARSATTLTQLQSTANKTYQQLQDDMKTLQDAKVEVGAKDAATWEAEQAEAAAKADAAAAAKKEAAAASDSAEPVDVKGKGKARDPAETPGASSPIADAEATARSLFSRLSTSTSAIQSQLQNSLNTTLASARASGLDDPAALRARLSENLRLGELKLSLQQAEKLAESYVAKGRAAGEAWAAEAERWVEENVKVVPPPDGAPVPTGGWDAGEWYAFSTSSPTPTPGGAAGGSTPRSASPGLVAGSRKDAMLARLRSDTALLLVDPAAETESAERREQYAAWLKENAEKIPAEKEKEVGHAGAMRMALVPEQLDDGVFWARYLFHRDMIEEQEQRRKALLMATTEEDDFSWDDGDDDEQPTPTTSVSKGQPAEKKAPAAEKKPEAKPAGSSSNAPEKEASPKATSPRDSEESYDVVSGRTTAAATESDDDSDWE